MFNKLISIIGMIAVYTIASGMDRLMNRLERNAGITFELTPLWWYRVAVYVMFSLVLTGLVWWVFQKTGRSKLVSFTFFGVGLLMLLIASPFMWGRWGDLARIEFPRIFFEMAHMGGLFFLTCTLIPVIGVTNLLPTRSQEDRS